MATPSEPSPRATKSRAKSRGANSGEQIVSRTVTKQVRRTDGLSTTGLSEQQRRELVEITAYYLAERRNFEPGHEIEDWIAAEVMVKDIQREK
jgi:prophage antirepressor-like protein